MTAIRALVLTASEVSDSISILEVEPGKAVALAY
jgi:hypothetical protein